MAAITKEQYQKVRKVVTGKVRCSYVSVFKPRQNPNSGDMEFSMELMIPKTDTKTVAAIQKAIKAAVAFKFPKGKPNPKVKDWYEPLIDADEEIVLDADQNEVPMTKKRPETKGCYLLRVKNKEAVPVVDAQKQPVIVESEFVSGDYARASINVHPFDTGKNAGTTFYLNAVQVVAKGEPLGGGVDVDAEFDEWDEEDGEDADADDWAA